MARHPFFRCLPVVAAATLLACDQQVDYTDVPIAIGLSSTDVVPIAILDGTPIVSQVTIIAATTGQAEGLAATVSYPGGVSGWLTATLDRSTVTPEQAAVLTLTADPAALPLGIYVGSVRLTATNVNNAPIDVTVRLTVDPRPPTELRVVTQPGGPVVAGQALPVQPVVQLYNDRNQPATVPNVVVTAATRTGFDGGPIGGVTATTDANGRATFTTLGAAGRGSEVGFEFSAPNLPALQSAAVPVLAGPAAQLTSANDTVLTATVANSAGFLVFAVLDDYGNGVPGFPLTFTPSPGSSVGPANVIATNSQGGVGVQWTLSQVAGANTLTVSADGLVGSPIRFRGTGTPGAPTVLTKVSGDNAIGLIGLPLGTPHVVKVADAFGNGVAGVTVTWQAGGGGSVAPGTTVTNAAGQAQAIRTLGLAPGPVTTTARAQLPTPLTVDFAVTAALAGPAKIVKVSGDAQTGTVNTALGAPITVQVLDAVDVPQANVTVSFTTAAPGGSFPGGATVTTNASGFATTTWRLGTVAGSQSAQAAVGGPAPAIFTATAGPGPLSVTQSTIVASPAAIVAGGAGSAITATARDAFANPIPGLATTLAVLGGANLTATTGTTNGAGQFTATLTSTTTGTKTVSASFGGQTIAQTATVGVTAATAVAMVAESATSFSVRFGQAVAPLPSVRLVDQFGNGVPGVTVTFGLTIGQGSISPSATVTNSSGIASLSSWVVAGLLAGATGEAQEYNTVVAASGALTPVSFVGAAIVSHSADLMQMYSFCASCHKPGGAAPGLNLSGSAAAVYQALRVPAGKAANYYVAPGDSVSGTASLNALWYWPRPGGSHTGTKYTTSRLTIVKAWIKQGALQN
ncbi:MAG: Ig-like domain-containing protein [Gemmatimonadales bacterium]